MGAAADIQVVADQYSDQAWRLNNLYYITDKSGRKVRFEWNWAQQALYEALWWRTDILKARQFGFSTFLLLYALDSALFNDYFSAGVIAHTLPDAKKLFETKILFPYQHLPEGVQAMRPAARDRADELKFNNFSSVSVSTSFRSGTLQWLHVSEFGKIAAKYPHKAIEIVTGAFEAVSKDGMIVIESTAEGRGGLFYDITQEARALSEAGRDLSRLDFRFFFMPWWRAEEYRIKPDGLPIPERLAKYFRELEKNHDITLDAEQQAWYVRKEALLKDKMFREYPSTADEAFQASVEGAYFTHELRDLRKSGRITEVPVIPQGPVDTWWDIGRDTTAIWFTQDNGLLCHVVDYYQSAGKGLDHYARVLAQKAEERNWHYGLHHWPHDMGNTDYSDRDQWTRARRAQELGLRGEVHPRMASKDDGIEAVRRFLPFCAFDEARCDQGLRGLESYRKEWNDKVGAWNDKPEHDWASHPADAFQQLALYHTFPAEQAHRVVRSAPVRARQFGV